MKILFVTTGLPFGGIERALIDNVGVLLGLGHKVDLLLREKRGEFLSQLPAQVRVYELPLSTLDRYEVDHGRVSTLKHALKTGRWCFAFRMLMKRFAWDLTGRRKNYDFEVVRTAVGRTPRIPLERYDIAIAYSADFPWSAIMTLDYVNAERKISWCHNERCSYQQDRQLFRDYYSRFDARYACSQATADRINRAQDRPGLVSGFPHLIDAAAIRAKGEDPVDDVRFTAPFKILTVGRVGEQKGSDVAVRVARGLKERGFKGKWFWIGNGNDRIESDFRRQIDEAGVGDVLVFLGAKQNPYPYIKACDLYVQPSRYEGYCLTVAEARVFNRPIVASDFDGAREQLQDGALGVIVEGLYSALWIDELMRIISDKPLRISFSEKLSHESPGTYDLVRRSWVGLLDGSM